MHNNKSKALIIVFLFLSVFIPSQVQLETSAHHDNTSRYQIESWKNNINPHDITPEIKLDENFGDQKTFWYYPPSMVGGDPYQIYATLLAIGEWCYVYLDNVTIDKWGYNVSLTTCTEIRDGFDSNIYPKGVGLAGHPNGTLGDIDGVSQVTILLAEQDKFIAGYYSYRNEYASTGSTSYSNEREMVYINSFQNFSVECYLWIIAHEFNHLIWWNNEISAEMTTLFEGFAEFTGYYSGCLSKKSFFTSEHSVNRSIDSDYFSDHPEQSLIFWNDNNLNLSLAHYGKSEMFIFYLFEKYGTDLIHDLIQPDVDGPLGIETALTNAGYDISFNDLFLDWIIACTIDNEDIENGLYGFDNTDFTISEITTIDNLPFTEADVKHLLYGFDVKKLINPPNEFTLKIANPYPDSIGISAAIYDDNGWSIAQTLNSEENGETIISHFTGENIEFAYIITSLMTQETPTNYAKDYTQKSPSKQLTYSFMKGHKRVSYNFLSFSILLIFLSTMIVIVRRRKQN
ncbi:MAG: hypothetical protein H7641_05215 [Candidatus Heimdallarchaeota archaeon]|nr:hypothetical protein [Candidatus Heimdallarchaeota archaeon]